MGKKYKKDETKNPVSTLQAGDHVETEQGDDLVVDEVLADDEFVAHLASEAPSDTPAEREWSLQDAARQMIVGYQDGWWPSLRAMGTTLALGETAPESACRACFMQWGAKLK